MKTHFLRAEWNNLVMANYIVPQDLLLPLLPYKTELNLFEGEAYVSLVGLMFLNTKVYGISIPLHENFEEINLRFYVKYYDHGNWKKGVVFIKEIVPKRAVSFIANNFYGENYETMNMKHFHKENEDNFSVGYEWKFNNDWNKLSAIAEKRANKIIADSCECFFADHYWGFTKYSNNKTYHYNVEHPVWQTFKVISHDIKCDFGALYGDQFAFLNNLNPKKVLMTKGSQINIHHKMELAD